MRIEITRKGKGGRPWRGTVNGVAFTGIAGFCQLVAELATPGDGCIKGIGSTNNRGYHSVKTDGQRYTQHALIRAWHESLDRPPTGLNAAHGPCHNRGCVNPHHLEFKLPGYNSQDQLRDGTYTAGERHGQSKLTDAQRAEIRALHATGQHTKAELARRYAVSRTAIRDLVDHTWPTKPITPERAEQIRTMTAAKTHTQLEIAQACETTRGQVKAIASGRTWNHTVTHPPATMPSEPPRAPQKAPAFPGTLFS